MCGTRCAGLDPPGGDCPAPFEAVCVRILVNLRDSNDSMVTVSRWMPNGSPAPRAVFPAAVLLLLSAALVPDPARAEDDTPSLDEQAVVFALQYGPVAVVEPSATGRAASRMRQPRDEWWAPDKAKHLVVSTLWTLSTQYVLVAKAAWSERDALPASIASAATVGLAKEIYDRRIGPTAYFSWKDLVADAAGIGIGAVVILL